MWCYGYDKNGQFLHQEVLICNDYNVYLYVIYQNDVLHK